MATIERVHCPSPEQFQRDYLSRQKPVILTGIASSWGAAKWTPEFFQQQHPDAKIRFETWEGDESVNDPTDFVKKQKYHHVPMSKYVELMRQVNAPSRKLYSAQFEILDVLPGLRGDLGSLEPYMGLPQALPAPVRKRLQLDPLFWMGPAGTLSTLHFDRTHNFFVQLYGRKKWIMVDPAKSPNVYWPSDQFSLQLFHFSPVDVEHPDFGRFPRYADADPLEFVVEPGEMLFVPATWWHYVESLEPSISLNFFWVGMLDNVVALKSYLYQLARTGMRRTLGLEKRAGQAA